MKNLLLFFACLLYFNTLSSQISLPDRTGTFTDPRDGKIYQTIKLINGKTWMAQNLNYDEVNGNEGRTYSAIRFWDRIFSEKTKWINYGMFYTWDAALQSCPKGWHLATTEEWDELIKSYRTNRDAYAFISLSDGGSSGLNVLLAGWRKPNKTIVGRNQQAAFWSMGAGGSIVLFNYFTEREGIPSHVVILRSIDETISSKNGLSCRCVQN